MKQYILRVVWIFLCFVPLFFTYYAVHGASTGSVFVLCYHTFIGKKTIATDFSVSEFAAHVQTLQKNGVRIVSLSDIHRGLVTGTRNVLIMFDDGNITAYRAYEQVLKPNNATAVFAIYPGIISRASYAMTWDHLRQLQKEGNAIVAHGYFHMYLTEKYAANKPKEFEDEFRRARQHLEKELQTSVNIFVHPFGIVSQSGKNQLQKNHYLYAYGLTQKPLQIPLQKNADRFDLPRYMLTRANVKAVLERIIWR